MDDRRKTRGANDGKRRCAGNSELDCELFSRGGPEIVRGKLCPALSVQCGRTGSAGKDSAGDFSGRREVGTEARRGFSAARVQRKWRGERRNCVRRLWPGRAGRG